MQQSVGQPADTVRFLQAAADLAASRLRNDTGAWDEARLAAFLAVYRHWIITELGMSEAPEEWAERSAILLHLMTGGTTIGEAIDMLVRFAHRIWEPRTRFEMVADGPHARLVFHEPCRPEDAGLICALWSLKSILIQIEFLAGGKLGSVSGQVRHARTLPGNVTNLLFGRPLVFGARDSALIMPRSELERAVAVRASDIPEFLQHFMRTMVGAHRSPNDIRSLMSTLLCDDRLRGSAEPAAMPAVARRLGMSVATARRRLRETGASFREVRAEAFDQLAKMWLREKTRSIDDIAEQLGYSDSHAFRRAFRKRNGQSPRTYRG